jgi:hypothetical protein
MSLHAVGLYGMSYVKSSGSQFLGSPIVARTFGLADRKEAQSDILRSALTRLGSQMVAICKLDVATCKIHSTLNLLSVL